MNENEADGVIDKKEKPAAKSASGASGKKKPKGKK